MKTEKKSIEKNLTACVSFFDNIESPTPLGEVTMTELLLSKRYSAQVESLRNAINEGNTELAQQIKRGLPCFTPAGIFSYRNKKGLNTFSGYIGIDIDAQDNAVLSGRVEFVRDILGEKIPYVAYSGLSCSGKGLFLLCHIAEDLERWGDYYNLIAEELSHYGLKPDLACKDICRLRFVSYDPKAYINTKATQLKLPLTRPEVAQIRSIMESINSRRMPAQLNTPIKNAEMPQIFDITREVEQLHTESKKSVKKAILQAPATAKKIEAIIEIIEAHDIDLTDKYLDWYKIGCAIASELGKQGREYYHRISAISSKYKREECDRQYNNILKLKTNDYTIATFVWYCNNAGLDVAI